MKFQFRSVLVLLLFTLVTIRSYTYGMMNDTIRRESVDNQAMQVNDLLRMKKLDSLEKADLIRQISSLRVNETRKRNELMGRLNELVRIDSLKSQAVKVKIDSLRGTTRGAPVMAFPNDTIFMIYIRIGSFSPEARAKVIAERIKKISERDNYQSDSLFTRESVLTTDICYGNEVIMGITELDARWMNTSADSLARRYLKAIDSSVLKYHNETSTRVLLKKTGIAAGILFLLTVVIILISRFFKWIFKRLEANGLSGIKAIRFRDYELLNTEREIRILILVGKMIKWILILVSVYISLPFIFSQFPWTKRLASTLLGYVLTPARYVLTSVWNYMPNLFTILVIVIVFRYTLKGIRFLKREVENGALNIPGFHPDLAAPTYQIIRFLIFAFMIVVIFPFLPGSNSPVFQGVSVFLGVLFTFGSSGSLGNLISGVMITYMRSFRIGDRVKIGEVTGDVVEKSMLVTRIRTIKNELISIPNSTVLGSHLTNYSSEAAGPGLILFTTVTIGYDAPWRKVHELLINAALATPDIEKQPAPFVLQTSLDDFYVSYQLNAVTRQPNAQAAIYSALHQNIQDKFNEAGLEIMSPHYRAARDGNTIAIPATYVGKDYEVPGFRVSGPKADRP